MKTPQITVLVLGILGGLAGIGSGVITMGLGGVGGALGIGGAGGIVGRGVGAIFLSIIGMIGGGIVGSKPKISGILMLLASLIGFLIIFPLYIPASALFLAGGVLALIGKKNKETIYID